jgi:acetolactate synthase-1/2/3 large subunit
VILAGNGVIRQGAADELVRFAEMLRIPVANTFMSKGVVPFSSEFSLGTIGLKARDIPWYAFERADVVLCVGYDMVEYHPECGMATKRRSSIRRAPAEVDGHYVVAGVLATSPFAALAGAARPQEVDAAVVRAIIEDRAGFANDRLPIPSGDQGLAGCWVPRILQSPTWAHKMWMARCTAEQPEHLHHFQRLCIDECGAGAIAAKLYPERSRQ